MTSSAPGELQPHAEMLIPDCRVERRLRVAVVGEFSSGKSTLLNSILEQKLMAVGPNPTTDRAHVFAEGGAAARTRGNAHFQLARGGLFTLGLELWDSPGVNVERSDHEASSRHVVAAADIILIVLRSDDASTRSARTLVARVDRDCPGRAPHPVVVTRVDQIDSDDPDELEEEIAEKRQEILEGFGRRDVFLVDARNLTRFDGPALKTALDGWVEGAFCDAFDKELSSPDHWMREHLAQNGAWTAALPANRVSQTLRQRLDALEATRDRARQAQAAAHEHAATSYVWEVRRAVRAEARWALRAVRSKHAAARRGVLGSAETLSVEALASLGQILRGFGRIAMVWVPLAAVASVGLWLGWPYVPPDLAHDPTLAALQRNGKWLAATAVATPFALYFAIRPLRHPTTLLRLTLVAAAVPTAWLASMLLQALDSLRVGAVTMAAWARATGRTDWLEYLREEQAQVYRAAIGLPRRQLDQPQIRLLDAPDCDAAKERGAWFMASLTTTLLPWMGTLALVGFAATRVRNVSIPSLASVKPALVVAALSGGFVWPDMTVVEAPGDLRMVPVRGGAFQMGAGPGEITAQADERPHPVVLSRSFLLSDAEATQGSWQQLMGTRPWSTRRRFWDEERSDEACSTFDDPGLPAVCVSWLDAIDYCNALSDASGLQRAYEVAGNTVTWRVRSDGYRLPTEAEWELAARAGTRDPWARSPGQDVCAVGVILDRSTRQNNAWIKGTGAGCDDGFPLLAPARQAPANPYGIRGMVGNVWEWVFDGYAEYTDDDVVDPAGPRAADARGVRGGAWFRDADDARVTNRYSGRAAGVSTNVGIRVARGSFGADDDIVVELPQETLTARAYLAADDAANKGLPAEEGALRGCSGHPTLGGECRLRLGQLLYDADRWDEAVEAWAPIQADLSRSLRAKLATARRKAAAQERER